jgi:methyltransferase family protein
VAAVDIHQLYRPFQQYFRRRRMDVFCELFSVRRDTRVLDVGGSELNWSFTAAEPQVTLLNLGGEEWERGRFRRVKGDATKLSFDDASFDIAYSNSVIEHVGDRQQQRRFADAIRRVAPRYYVQTPNKWFFVEPHLLTVGLHWLPRPLARRVVRRGSVWGWVERPSQAGVDDMIDSINMLDRDAMQELFPDAEIIEERALGMTKSLIAVRR